MCLFEGKAAVGRRAIMPMVMDVRDLIVAL